MKIAYCLPDQRWVEEIQGGNTTDAAHLQQKYIAEGLCARGHTITFIAPRDFDQVMYAHPSNPLTPAPQTWTASGWFKLTGKLVWKFQQLFHIPYLNFFSNLHRFNACLHCLPGHDVAFERNSLYNSGVAMASKDLNMPYVMFFDADQFIELDFMGKPLKGLLRWNAKRFLRYNLNTANCIICVSESAKKHLITNWDLPSNRIIVLPNAVDVEHFKPDPKMRAETRASLRIATNPLVIFVGSFYPWHDVATLLKAFAIVLKTHTEARLILIGDGTEREKMTVLSTELGIGHAVQFIGFVGHADVPYFVNAADIAVVPVQKMKADMWLSPMKLFEYMASGKAVVATASGQIKEVVKDGRNGLLVSAGDTENMAEAIGRLAADTDLGVRLGRQAREDAVQNHSWEQYLSRLENVFGDVLLRKEVK